MPLLPFLWLLQSEQTVFRLKRYLNELLLLLTLQFVPFLRQLFSRNVKSRTLSNLDLPRNLFVQRVFQEHCEEHGVKGESQNDYRRSVLFYSYLLELQKFQSDAQEACQ